MALIVFDGTLSFMHFPIKTLVLTSNFFRGVVFHRFVVFCDVLGLVHICFLIHHYETFAFVRAFDYS